MGSAAWAQSVRLHGATTVVHVVVNPNRAAVEKATGLTLAACQEQSSGVDLVNRAVVQMDHVTQSNAAQTEELQSTAESLAAQAQQLQVLVARFKIDDDEQSGPQPIAAVAAPAMLARAPRSAPKPSAAKAKATSAEPALVEVVAGAPSSRAAKGDEFEEF